MDFSIVIPAFNAESNINGTLENILSYDFDKALFEVIVVNDGSTDKTKEVVDKFIKDHPELNVRQISKKNGGVGSARNVGILEASGDYVLFLDSDDYLSTNALSELNKFIKKNPIQIVVYNLKYTRNNNQHWRHKLLHSTGVYDSEEFCYAALTTINFCVKNKGKELLFKENYYLHEDEEYAARNVLIENKFGYVEEATYFYNNENETSVTNTRLNPFYSFSQSLKLYDELIKYATKSNKYIPKYIQALIMNDLGWKLRSNVLYSEAEILQKEQESQVIDIVKRIDSKVIFDHPNIDYFHKFYFLRLKKDLPRIYFEGEKIILEICDRKEHIKQNQIYISNYDIDREFIRIKGFFKNIICDYLDHSDVKLYIRDGNEIKKLKNAKTYYSYHRCRTLTNNFIGIDAKIQLKDLKSIEFLVEIKGHLYKINKFYFKNYPFPGSFAKRNIDYVVKFDSSAACFVISKNTTFRSLINFNSGKTATVIKAIKSIALMLKKSKKIFIYNDREKLFDNAYLLFKNAVKQKDEIYRYYVYFSEDDKKKLIEEEFIPKNNLIKYRSLKHQILYLSSRKIITSFADESFYLPISNNYFKKFYVNDFSPEVIYVQHGVLHAKTLHYAKEYLNVNKVLISTTLEKQYLQELGYSKDDLLETGAPRYENFQLKKNSESTNIEKILYLPSWRSYLAIRTKNNRWHLDERKLLNSKFWNELQLLNDHIKGDLDIVTFDIKFHPIFSNCQHLIKPGLLTVTDVVDLKNYDLIITDYSSIVYDIVALGKPIIYFCPDYMEYKHGLNMYSDTLTPIEDGYGPLATCTEELINTIKEAKTDKNLFTKYDKKYQETFLSLKNPLEDFYQFEIRE